MECTEKKSWFAMSATYRRELKIKQILDKLEIKNFVPMSLQHSIKNGQKESKLIPLIHNLIFVYCEFTRIQEIKNRLSYLQFLTNSIDGKKRPILIRDKDMDNFINLIEANNQTTSKAINNKIEVLEDHQVNIKKGTKVKIKGGPFNGREGHLIKVKGRRNRCFVVSLKGVMNVLIQNISLSMLEIME